MLDPAPDARPTVPQLLADPWVAAASDLWTATPLVQPACSRRLMRSGSVGPRGPGAARVIVRPQIAPARSLSPTSTLGAKPAAFIRQRLSLGQL
jgi:hypothetical protein